jgi:hypothetical protein
MMSHGVMSGWHGSAASHRGQASSNDEWRPLDMMTIQTLSTVYDTDIIARACRDAIVARLLSGGVHFVKSNLKVF